MVRLAELIVILELHQQGMTVSAIARRTGLHRSTVAKYVARGIEPPAYGPRSPRPTKLTPFERCLRERIAAVPELTGSRLHREVRELGYAGGYTVLKDFLRQVRPRMQPLCVVPDPQRRAMPSAASRGRMRFQFGGELLKVGFVPWAQLAFLKEGPHIFGFENGLCL